MKYTEKQLDKMASPINQTEDVKCKHAINMIRDAMKTLNYIDDEEGMRFYVQDSYSYLLNMRQVDSGNKIKLLLQGSYANKTNISSESDVDIAVILESSFTVKWKIFYYMSYMYWERI